MPMRAAGGARARLGAAAAGLALVAWGCTTAGRPRLRFVHVVQCQQGFGGPIDDYEPRVPVWKSEQERLECQRAAPPALQQATKRWSKTVDLAEIPACAQASAGMLRHNDAVYQQPPLPRCGTSLVAVRKRLPRGDESQEVCVDPTYLSDTKPGRMARGEWLLIEARVDPRAPTEVAWRQRGRFETHHHCAARRWELLRDLERAPEGGAGRREPPAMECRCRPVPEA